MSGHLPTKLIGTALARAMYCLAYPESALAAGVEKMSFRNGAITLYGELLLPGGAGPFPAIVFLHGSGCSSREQMRPVAAEIVAEGYAALLFDKRGCGESNGSWVSASLQDLAGDAEAAIDYLLRRVDIDGSFIGYWTVSQSGWVAPIAAAGMERERFLVVVTGGGASPREVETFGYEQKLRMQGRSLENIPTARALLDAYFTYLKTGHGREELLDRIESAKQAAWYEAMNLERVLPSESTRAAWAWVATYDPATDIANLTAPTLVLLGAKDRLLPTLLSARKWSEGLEEAAITGSRVVIFADAGHGLTVGGQHGHAESRGYALGFTSTVISWLEQIRNGQP